MKWRMASTFKGKGDVCTQESGGWSGSVYPFNTPIHGGVMLQGAAAQRPPKHRISPPAAEMNQNTDEWQINFMY